MSTTTTNTDQIVKALTRDGDIWWNDDETIGYRLTIETDDVDAVTQINGCDGYGRVAWAVADRDTGHYRRPSDFTGAARLLRPNGWHIDSPVWWEPYREGHKVYATDADVSMMTELLADGFKCVAVTHLIRREPNITHYPSGVSYCHDCSCRLVLMDDDTHECDESIDEGMTESLSGIGSLEGGYLAEVVGELLEQIG